MGVEPPDRGHESQDVVTDLRGSERPAFDP